MPMDVEFFYTETLESISVTPLGSFEECAIRWNEIVQEVGFGVETDAGDAEEEADTGLEEDEDGHGSDGVDQVEEIQVVEPEQEINDPIELESDHENDQQFDQELKRMMQESLDSRKLDKKSGFDVAIPTRPKQKPSSTPSDKIAFAVLTKGGKLKSIDVPLTSVFVKDTLEAKIREEKERGEVKKMVLKLEETRVDEQVSIEPIWNAPAKGKRWDDDDFQI
jgi:regulator of nonsense transcripts 2